MTLQQRFEMYWSRGEPEACWLWTGAIAKNGGNGIFGTKGDVASAHATAYRFYIGEVPAGQHVYHRCETPLCVNPAHLFLAKAWASEEEWHRAAGLPVPTTRTCRGCSEAKPLDDFPAHQFGRRNWCSSCWADRRSLYYSRRIPQHDYLRTRNRAKREGATEFMTFAEWRGLRALTTCHWCQCPLHPSFTHMDHIRPLSWGGQHTKDNVVPSCANCNLRRKWENQVKYPKGWQ